MKSTTVSTMAATTVALLFAAQVVAAGPTVDLSYKGTRFGASEQTFLQQHAGENFVCADAPPSSVGRWCSSKSTTFGNEPSSTIAQFLNDRLVLITISFAPPASDVADAAFDVAMTSQLQQRYGKPSAEYWPGQTSQGAPFWKKVWHLKGGAAITYIHFDIDANGSRLEQRNVFLQSKEADKLITCISRDVIGQTPSDPAKAAQPCRWRKSAPVCVIHSRYDKRPVSGSNGHRKERLAT